jgi:hypothetical protein
VIATIAVGTVSGWLTLCAIVGGLWVFIRGGGGAALTALREANDVLEKRVRELEAQVELDRHTIAALSAKTDIAKAILPLIETVTTQDKAAQGRFDHLAQLLTLILDRLTPQE